MTFKVNISDLRSREGEEGAASVQGFLDVQDLGQQGLLYQTSNFVLKIKQITSRLSSQSINQFHNYF